MKTTGLFLFCLLALTAIFGYSQEGNELVIRSQEAKQLMASGDFGQAISVYRELNQQVPNNAGLRLNLGMALHMAGRKREAIPQLERAVTLDPRLEPAWLFLGATHLQLGQPIAAVKPLRTVLGLDPAQHQARQMLAEALFLQDRFQEAMVEYRTLTEFEPQSAPAWYGLGRCYESLAGRTFDELEKTAPGSGYLSASLAQSQLREQQFSSAFFLYRRALEQMPTLHGLHGALAEIYRQTGHPAWAEIEDKKESQLQFPSPVCPDQALECQFTAGHFEKLIRAKDANTAERLYWRSRAYNELAMKAFARLGQLPPSAEQHELKARIYSNQKKYTEAAGEWREALKLSPSNMQIQKELAISLKLSQDYAGALTLFQQLLREQPTSSELNYLVGDTLLDQQRPEEAIPLLKRVVTQNPKSLPAQKSLARAELAAGNEREAIRHLKLALPADTDGTLHYQLAQAYQASGQPELAKKARADYAVLQQSATAARERAQREMEITPP